MVLMSSGKRDKKNRNGNIISKSRYNPRNNIRQEKIKYDRIDTDDPNDNNHLVIKDSIERNKYVLDSVNMWINNADSKIGLAFAILSAILALIVFVTEDWLSKIEHTKNDNTLMYFFYSFVVLSVVFFLLSVIFYFLCIIPRFTSDNKKNTKYSIFYNEIKDFDSYIEYIKSCEKITGEIFNEEIVKEIYFNSCICSKKMKYYKAGIIFSVLSIIFALVSALLYYLAIT